jgi:hypothetical protein
MYSRETKQHLLLATAGAKDNTNGEGSIAKKDALHWQQAMAWKLGETCPLQVT